MIGYLGQIGAGKTTTIHLLLGLVSGTRGRADIFEVDSQANPVETHHASPMHSLAIQLLCLS